MSTTMKVRKQLFFIGGQYIVVACLKV